MKLFTLVIPVITLVWLLQLKLKGKLVLLLLLKVRILSNVICKIRYHCVIFTGAGIHVFRGIPTGSFTNNSLVSLNTMDMTFRLRFFCRSDSMMEGVGELIGLDGSLFGNSILFGISNPQPGELSVVNFVTNSTDLTAGEQGVYTCRIPLQSGEMMEISIGIYPSGFTSK